jgi:hypothetical protein
MVAVSGRSAIGRLETQIDTTSSGVDEVEVGQAFVTRIINA